MYFHLVCSPEFFAVASSRKSTREAFLRSCELMVLKDHDKEGPYQDRPPLCPFRL